MRFSATATVSQDIPSSSMFILQTTELLHSNIGPIYRPTEIAAEGEEDLAGVIDVYFGIFYEDSVSPTKEDEYPESLKNVGTLAQLIAETDSAALDLFAKYGIGMVALKNLLSWWGGDSANAGKTAVTNPIEKYYDYYVYSTVIITFLFFGSFLHFLDGHVYHEIF